ncbi:ABC transporter permease subunit [Cellulomonas edaphi]|uniref:ABC transporter permease subunit n=1 Tax=Cellulomonas edaphi TaxID=3053468 RepID=A0ABT7S9W2_9CELL|nr:ABC transporter permease subunit [Cellulomons edaphi]MDM7832413.1 ABC transporter permease subunit [Cellulomons edaphi]
MRLVGVELFRFRSRAFSWLVAGLLLLVAVGFAIEAWHDTRPPSAATVAAAREAYESDVEAYAPDGPIQTQCREALAKVLEKDPDSTLTCHALPTPRLEEYLVPPRTFADAVTSAVDGLTGALVVAAIMAATSFVTAEFSTGSMGLWLTFVPRRSAVFASKTIAAMAAAAVFAAGGWVAVVLAITAVHAASGQSVGDVVLWGDLLATGARQVALAVVVASIAAALAFSLRHAAAVFGVLVWWVVSIELVLGEVSPTLRPVSLGFNAQAWVHGHASYVVDECIAVDDCRSVEHVVGAAQGGVVLLVVAAVVAGVGLVVFRRRDVS